MQEVASRTVLSDAAPLRSAEPAARRNAAIGPSLLSESPALVLFACRLTGGRSVAGSTCSKCYKNILREGGREHRGLERDTDVADGQCGLMRGGVLLNVVLAISAGYCSALLFWRSIEPMPAIRRRGVVAGVWSHIQYGRGGLFMCVARTGGCH